MKIAIFGTGYVGLVTGTCFAKLGNEVTCYDIDKDKIARLKDGDIPIYEPNLKELVERNYKGGRLFFTDNEKEAVDFGDLIFIAVGTPSNMDGDADLSYVKAVAKAIGKNLDSPDKIIVNKSTVPVGTASLVRSIIQKELDLRQKDFRFGVASNPEFLKEGHAIEDFMKPDRIVVGTNKDWVIAKMEELYSPFTKKKEDILIITDIASAEMSKYASNGFLANKISYINEISVICDAVGADVESVRKIMSTDKRIGVDFLYPGIGYGGSCFPKDVKGLSSIARDNGCKSRIIDSVDTVNTEQRWYFIRKIRNELPDLRGKNIAVWGLSFKPNTDDMREAPSVTIIDLLVGCQAKVTVYDPVATEEARKIFGDKIAYSKNEYDCVKGADALILITEWEEFRSVDFDRIKKLMTKPLIIDGRNIYSPDQMQKAGFTYVSIGRAKVSPL